MAALTDAAMDARQDAELRGFGAAIFDMDGVVTRTARLHADAWKETFDAFLAERRAAPGEPAVRPFDAAADYRAYVDGKPRAAGVRSFLAARGIELPEGDPGDPPEAHTVQGLAKRKDASFARRLRRQSVEVFDSTLALIRALRETGVKTGVVTSSRHGREVLHAAGIAERFDVRMDGIDAAERALRGKPHPDAFLACAQALGVSPARAVVVEDAVAGVEAGRRGGFGLVIGIDRGGNREALAAHGADLVVGDLAELGLEQLTARWRARQVQIAWRIEQEGFSSAREDEMESIFTVGNGYLAVRGALDAPPPGAQADLFIAGIYDRKQPTLPYSEREFLHVGHRDYPYTELVSAPFPFRVRLRVDGQPLAAAADAQRRTLRRVLDLRQGVLHQEALFESDDGRRTTVQSRRCASLADPHLLLQEIRVRLENHSAEIELDPPRADNADELAAHPHLTAIPGDGHTGEGQAKDVTLQRFATRASGFEIATASLTELTGFGAAAGHWRVPATVGDELVFRRRVAVYTSRDGDEPGASVVEHLLASSAEDFEAQFAAHGSCWAERWDAADIRVPGNPAVEQALRFNAYHLLSAADHDPRVSVGGRALTGRAYEGHVFWDVEIFMLPFYLHTCPAMARSLLLYRYHTLDGARRRAHALGYRGACYAWESTVTGDDVTPVKIVLKSSGKEIPIFTGAQQIHVTADVAYGVWHYWQATRDDQFLREAGVEILIETARFWTSRCERDQAGYHIRGVVGPDEYHHSVDDNAYTNWMARFNLEQAAWAARWLQEDDPRAWTELVERLRLTPDEPIAWAVVTHELYCPRPNEQGVIEQFAGFFELQDYPLPAEERFRAPISRLFDWDTVNGLKLIKQADVLMLFHLFPEQFSQQTLAANYAYYEPLTDHGSSLSPPVHAGLAARLGLREQAERYWRRSLWLDLSNGMSNSTLGVHPACMGATWHALVFGFLGVTLSEAGPTPAVDAGTRLPAGWSSVALRMAWRGRSHDLEVRR